MDVEHYIPQEAMAPKPGVVGGTGEVRRGPHDLTSKPKEGRNKGTGYNETGEFLSAKEMIRGAQAMRAESEAATDEGAEVDSDIPAESLSEKSEPKEVKVSPEQAAAIKTAKENTMKNFMRNFAQEAQSDEELKATMKRIGVPEEDYDRLADEVVAEAEKRAA